MRDEEQNAVKAANDADRAAKYNMKRNLRKLEKYKSATLEVQTQMLEEAEEEMAQKRFDTVYSSVA